MNQQWIVICFLIACVHLTYQISTPESPTYIAAVVEYHPKYITNSNETLKRNSIEYCRYIEDAKSKNADIIVFPEDGLTTVRLPKREDMKDWTTIIPAASDNYTPCIDNKFEISDTLRKISCAARDNEIYVVINIAEKLPCKSMETVCPSDKIFYYNSNVVFDRTGKIIARYRKTNLFGEHEFNVTPKPEIVTFDTDFGVKFGTFTCFDILFYEPALNLTRFYNITDIVFPTAWFSETPFLTAVQTQAGWSFSEDVNFLVSGYNEPTAGSTGSGIYLGRGGIGTAIMSNTIDSQLLIYEVPKKKNKFNKNYYDHSNNQQIYDYKEENIHQRKLFSNITENNNIFLLHDNIDAFITFPLDGIFAMYTICVNDFCCDFDVILNYEEIDSSTKYRLVYFSGTRLYGSVEAGARVCGIIQCSNDSISSCGSVQKSKTVFNSIEIGATFHDYQNTLIMPSTLRSDLLPFFDWTYHERVHDDHVHISMVLNESTNNLVTFGIYSRYFDKSSANKTSHVIYYLIAQLMALYLLRL